MSRPFRPRPLDIHKKLPIVKSVKDLDIDEAAVVSRASLHTNVVIAYSDNEPVRAHTPSLLFLILK
jgi:enhancer of polycomb-like protein